MYSDSIYSNSSTTSATPASSYIDCSNLMNNIISDYTTSTSPSYIISSDIAQSASNSYTWNTNIQKDSEDKHSMANNNFGLDFGPVTDNKLAVSPFGITIKNTNGNYCYYDAEKCQIIDCTPFTFDTKKFLYKVPVAVSAIEIGDIIIHNGVPMFVKGYEDEEGRILVIDVVHAEEKLILPVRNVFGFNYITKVISLLDPKNCNATSENPFGNMLPFLMLMNDKDLDPLMLLMMNGGQIGGLGDMDTFMKNPLMMYMMMKDNKNLKDMLPFLMMTSATPVQR